jgi:YfiH family protein
LLFLNKNGVCFYQFPNLAKFGAINHGIFTRHNGCSQGPFQSLNIAGGIGDNEKNVHKNRRIISRCIQGRQLVFADQVHGDHVLVVEKNPTAPLVGDAMVTNLRQQFLVIQVADCQAVMLYDPDRQVVANIHAGWRGSIQNIIGHTLKQMENRFGCRAHHVVAGIGPSLGPCCAEFVNYIREIPEKFWKYKDACHHFDFWAVSRDQLLEAGVPGKNINTAGICTKCNQNMFFSYRRQGTTGRFAAVIGLR